MKKDYRIEKKVLRPLGHRKYVDLSISIFQLFYLIDNKVGWLVLLRFFPALLLFFMFC